MSKLEQILASNARSPVFKRKSVSGRARLLMLLLTSLLIAFVFLTQPPVREAVEPLLSQIPGL
ncbi:hypothetical protein SAMN05444358_1011661 [Ruegeria halocynthiae]|uniref:Uncharacterized protein n=1 Tax=Ruegeria halocynthiae TaxID=985054 RepID=A0A1H2W382_9RHOB|nr:hypothetical protein [Ruegeria halocynthiae]SDW75001.1 hypothetical protein SAMN05444358_1011661 [Ruegeria halocynthiae]